jgi:GH25 family lysozyme M1 (1,4-beta-N-acetylmuramidase)
MLIGIDYASVDGNAPPDIQKWKAACAASSSRAAVAILRGAWGAQRDLTIQRDWRRLIDAGLTCGGYLFLRNPQPGFDATPEDQVHAFADNMGTLNDRNLVPTIDVEDASHVAAEAELEWVHRAWTAMRDVYGVPPMIYTSDRVWREDLGNLPAGEMTDSPLWLAKPWPWQVRTAPHLSSSPFDAGKLDPAVPAPWGVRNWWLHQYQGDAFPVPGFTSTVDLSRFNVMRTGEVGARVAWARTRLGLGGLRATFDGDMVKRVREFQLEKALVVDGIIGPKTFAALAWVGSVVGVRAA